MNTVKFAATLVARGHIYVVSSDENVASVASELGVHCDGGNDIDLNSALTWSIAKILTREHEKLARNVLILPIDLAFITQAAIAPVIAAQADVVVVPDRLSHGTNLLRLRGDVATNFKFQYGDNSFSKHLAEAGRLGLTAEILRGSLLCFDVDTPADYAAWVSQAGEPANVTRCIEPSDR